MFEAHIFQFLSIAMHSRTMVSRTASYNGCWFTQGSMLSPLVSTEMHLRRVWSADVAVLCHEAAAPSRQAQPANMGWRR